MERFIGLAGIAAFVALAYLLSHKRSAIHWRTILWGLGLQWIFALIVLKGTVISSLLSFLPFPKGAGWVVLVLMFTPLLLRRFASYENKTLNWGLFGVIVLGLLRGNLVGSTFDKMRVVVEHLMAYAHEGASFVFGSLSDGPGGKVGMVFAFAVLPTIIFVASIFAVLYYLGVMQWVVTAAARAMGRFLKVSGAESVSVAASILMGQTEAPLTIRPFLAKMTRSELMVIMTAGMAHVSGSIMVAYVQVAHVDIVHLLTAVIMTAPGAVMMAKLLEPETGTPETAGEIKVDIPNHDANVLDAAARGAFEGGQLAFNVAVMLIAFIALIFLINGLMKAIHPGFSLEWVLGGVFKIPAFLMGVPWSEAGQVGGLLGKRMVVNEFVAFLDLGAMTNLSAKARLISTFALCGFANFSSIAIQVGGIGALVPERRGDLARLGVRAMLAGTLANFLSACIAGILT
ncbi:NupC/NupG family nucleoside CNT transporter [Geothrix sp. PMB-07]|uniref:NupC/NupG family nucleoside CNT transporter n=1 Tax=Geothrix sp. PMB-07 TaxID=3068640 RepID=UPI002740F19B|nr:nucleoside transporter C-terminal domain-containing protein [Geothrix sp. PMB-07]WLT31549.1 nucleoside transporter C-terminal domain-containing protein [Geothrix sp. PMB-07]